MTTTTTSPALKTAWTGSDLLGAFEFATRWLDHNRESINALNVFPIPDGDTGTNMTLTMHAAMDAARTAPDPASAGSVASGLSYGALMGARGNSGVILSQVFRGFASAIANHDVIDGKDLADALGEASRMAYKSVMQPVEGTMLTVVRVASEYAAASASKTNAIVPILWDALDGASTALEHTPEQLDILRQAGVVDAGGQGIVRILEGLYRYIQGNTTIEDEQPESTPTGAGMQFLDDLPDLHGEDPFGYCTNFMIFGKDMDFPEVRDTIAGMGQSAVIVGDDSIVKVHIHTEHPGSVLEYAVTLGSLDQIKIDNMTLQADALAHQREQAKQGDTPIIDGTIGIIAVAAGEGLATALTSMGAHLVVPGGQTMNPSTEQLLDAARRMPVDEIIILPNNKNIIMAANQVDSLSDKTIRVVPSRSVPQGLAALASFTRDVSLESNVTRMTEALDDVHDIEITHAVRGVDFEGISVKTGELIGLVDGKLAASGSDLADVVNRVLSMLGTAEPELLTIFTGEDATSEATTALGQLAHQVFPDAEIEVLDGGQPHYMYLISAE